MVTSVKKISIVIPLYNSQDIIERVLDSLKNQTRIDLVKEIIIVNDGSKDRSGEVCDSYAAKDPRIHVIHKENGGAQGGEATGLGSRSELMAKLGVRPWVLGC